MKKGMKKFLVGMLAFAMMLNVIPAQTVSAKPAKLSEKDFYYVSSDGYEMSLMEKDDPWGRVNVVGQVCKTKRGIKVGSKLSAVKSKYGDASKKKFDNKESFNKYIRQYYQQHGSNSISAWKNYVEYSYKKNTKDDRRLRFYLDKNDKVTEIVYIYRYKYFKLSNKKVNIGFSFQAPSGQKITTKTIAGKKVQILPANTKIKFKKSKVPEFGILGSIFQYDKKGRVCGETMTSLNFGWQCTSGTKIGEILTNEMYKVNPNTHAYKGRLNVNKLGSYNYFEFKIYDVDYKGGYDRPTVYYFKMK